MTSIKRVVLDIMKPHEPNIVELADILAELPSVENVNLSVVEVDKTVENIKATIEGEALHYDEIADKIQEMAGAIHSIDLVVAGKKVIEETHTPQD